jgi:hypothetical protein
MARDYDRTVNPARTKEGEEIPAPPCPEMAEIWAFVASVDPLLVQAVADVDRRLLRHSLDLPLSGRLREVARIVRWAGSVRRVASA